MLYRIPFYCLFYLSVFVVCQAQSRNLVDVSELSKSQPNLLSSGIYYATDSECNSPDHLRLLDCNLLTLSNTNSPNFGFTSEKYWFTFQLLNNESEQQKIYVEIAYALLDKMDIQVFDHKGALQNEFKLGDHYVFDRRPIKHPFFTFPVIVPSGAKLDVVYSVSTSSSMQVPITLWYPEAYVATKSTELLLFGLFIGAMLVMAGYNLMLSLSTADKSYFLFSLSLAFYALVQMDLTGLSYAYLWSNSPNWNDVSLVVVTSIAILSISAFSRTFLQLNQNSLYTHRLLKLGEYFCVCLIIASFFVEYRLLVAGLSLVVASVPTAVYFKGISLWLKGYRPARYFVVAFSLFVFSALIFVASKFGIIERNIFTEYSVHFGALAVVTMLSLALADRVNRDRKDKEMAQASSIVSLRKFETLYNSTNEGFFELDINGRLIAANPAFCHILGASSLDQIIASYSSFDHLLDHMHYNFVEQVQKNSGAISLDFCCIKVDGERIWAAINARLMSDPTSHKIRIEGSLIDITDRKNNEKKLQYLADYDQLTGLLNRNAFQTRLSRLIETAIKNQTENALLYIDLDRFKVVNDSCGHLAGDELLQQLAVIFTHQVRQRDATARIGGDEFAVLLENCDTKKALEIAEALKAALNKYRFNWHGKQFDIGASIGIVPINQYSEGVVSLLNLADSVCMMAKEQGRDRIILHDENAVEINDKIQAKNLLATIHEAIESDNFLLYQQVIHDFSNPEAQMYEVLLRLKLDTEIVSPGVFIPTAERYNVMPKIDKWVVQEYVRYLSSTSDVLACIKMATINLSGQTLSNRDFLPFLVSLLERYPMVSKKICFELTESAALNNLSESSELVTKMKSLGVKFAVDDFGSGYASYSYLTQLPIDFVKIDGSFCLDIDKDLVNQTVVRSITDISHMMGMKVIAEFVETEEAYACLQKIGVDMVQGYYLAKPCAL